MDIVRKKASQLLAVELLASAPNMTNKEVASKLGVSAMAIGVWMRDPLFIDALYKRYMEVAGIELPNVVGAMIREAKSGNVQAGRLILEHFGKLDTRVKIQVESPFEKFLNIRDVEDAEFVNDDEITNGSISIANQASDLMDDDVDIPDRDPANDKPGKRKKEEKKALEVATRQARRIASDKDLQKEMYQRRKRAKAVGLELLPAGRSTKGSRDKWWKELERLEINKFGETQE